MNAYQKTLKQSYTTRETAAHIIAPASLGFAMLAGIAALIAGPGSRLGWWYFMTGFKILQIAAICGFVAAILSLFGGLVARHDEHRFVFLFAAAGIVVGLVTAGIPWSWLRTAEQMPNIHDISTDMVNPPRFVAIAPLRQLAGAPSAYGGPEVAAQQRAAYPDIRPLILPIAPSSAFHAALKTAQHMGWRIVGSSVRKGRIEAIATTFWFGFKDDVVVRIRPVPGGSRVDVRSASRVGTSDVGTNATRVRAFLHELADSSIVDNKYTSFSEGY